MKTFQQIGTAAGALVEEKNRAYGSSFATTGPAMRLLYPNGIAPDQLADALVVVRIWDKLMRIATDRDALGESPYNDIIGYGILGVHMHQAPEGDTKAPCGSVSAKVAANESQAPSDFAAPGAPPPTTPNASASSARSSEMPSPQPSPSTYASKGALAHTARVAALFGSASENRSQQEGPHSEWKSLGILSREEVVEAARLRNSLGYCAHCGSAWHKGRTVFVEHFDGTDLAFCEEDCRRIFCFWLGGRA